VKYCVHDRHQSWEPRDLDVGVQNYLLKLILDILVKCSVLITVLIVICSVDKQLFVKSRAYPLQCNVVDRMIRRYISTYMVG
jgi:hypothetical protein